MGEIPSGLPFWCLLYAIVCQTKHLSIIIVQPDHLLSIININSVQLGALKLAVTLTLALQLFSIDFVNFSMLKLAN